MAVSPPVVVPPVLYLPVLEHPEGGGPIAVVRQFTDGRTGILVYTALDRLSDACGALQPWILINTGDLDRIGEAQPFDLVAFDLEIPASMIAEGRLA